jgi:hypothetical protein
MTLARPGTPTWGKARAGESSGWSARRLRCSRCRRDGKFVKLVKFVDHGIISSGLATP